MNLQNLSKFSFFTLFIYPILIGLSTGEQTIVPDEFCDFETDKCIWDGGSLTWKWKRQKISNLDTGPPYDHRGGNKSEYKYKMSHKKLFVLLEFPTFYGSHVT